MLKSINRLKKKKEFSFIYKKGKSFHNKFFSLYVVGTKYKNSKIGFSINNKVGNSVVRHKLKRRLSEILMKKLSSLPLNNYVFVVKVGSDKLNFEGLKIQVENMLEKLKNDKQK